jgi:DNA-binding transcriptional LysR family regulator
MNIENTDDLKVLLHTAQAGTLTGASHAMGITPAAASATLKRLEAQLGVRLFERSTRSMRLTAQGQLLLDYATRAFEMLAEGESLVTADRGALSGTVRVVAPSDLARTTLLPWITEFLGIHPGLHVFLSTGDKPSDILRDEVDLALRYGNLSDSRLVARQLVAPQPVLCAAPSYLQRSPPLDAPKDLASHNCLTFFRAGRRHRLWRFARDGQWTEVRVDGDRSVDDSSLAREWAAAGAGVLLKSGLDVRHELRRGALVRLLPDWETEPYTLHAILPSGRFIPARVRALVDFLALKFQADALSASLP